MNDLLLQLLPLILGATLVPLYPIVVLLLLQSDGGLPRAAAFVAGAIGARLLQGLLFGLVFGAAAETYPDYGPEIIASTLLTLLGIMLLVAAFKKWRKQPDPDEPPPQWMTRVAGLPALQAFGAGVLIVVLAVKQWVFTLAAIDVIEVADLDAVGSFAAYLGFTLATQVLVLVPIVACAVAPQRTAGPVAAAQAWLERHNRAIVIAVSIVFGLYFLQKGISGLAG